MTGEYSQEMKASCPHPKDCTKNGCSGCCEQDPPICAKPEPKAVD